MAVAFTMKELDAAYRDFIKKHESEPRMIKMNRLTWRDLFYREFPSGILPPEPNSAGGIDADVLQKQAHGHFRYAFRFRNSLLEFDDTVPNGIFHFVTD